MDTSDPEIVFDSDGVCNHCHFHDQIRSRYILPAGEREKALEQRIRRVKAEGRGKKYDCIIGLSGGVDSSYIALKVKELGLRPLAVHMDGGWNSELAVSNIENIVDRLGIDLFTNVVEWDEMRDLQLSFFRSGVPNCDIPQDHAIIAVLLKAANAFGVRTIVRGLNIATESVLPQAWGYSAIDLRHIKAIHKKYGQVKLKTFPTCSILELAYYYAFKKITYYDILNNLEYDKDKAKELITAELGWRDYGGKHHESLFTKFFQSYYLVKKFGFDKRLAHYSSLVLAGSMTRDQALVALEKPPYDDDRMHLELNFVANKMEIEVVELERIIASPPRRHTEFPSYKSLLFSDWATRIRKFLK
jgi:N-acetyl sugar amidotransferase